MYYCVQSLELLRETLRPPQLDGTGKIEEETVDCRFNQLVTLPCVVRSDLNKYHVKYMPQKNDSYFIATNSVSRKIEIYENTMYDVCERDDRAKVTDKNRVRKLGLNYNHIFVYILIIWYICIYSVEYIYQ